MAAKLAQIEARRIEDLTGQDLFDSRIVDGVRRKNGSAALKRLFVADVLPKVGGIAIKAVTEHDVCMVMRALVDRGINRTAVTTQNSLMHMFACARSTSRGASS